MKKYVSWFGLSALMAVLMAVVLVFSSCSTATTPSTVTQTATQTSTETAITTTTSTQTTIAPVITTTTSSASGTPQLGGILNVIGYRTSSPPTSWDSSTTNANTDYWTDPFAEFLLAGNIEGVGPRGTNQFSFQVQETIPESFLTGELATSYEQPDPLTIIFHLRKGVMWTGNTNIGMAPREFTATDAAFSLNRYWKSQNGGANLFFLSSITAQDQYTLVIKFNTYSPMWFYLLGYGYKCSMVAPEEVAAANGGASNWKNQVGTGPFVLTDWVSGSYAQYNKNPNYWGTTTINGKQYQTPLVDTLMYPVIIDSSTSIAAIRTGKIDVSWAVSMTNKSTLNSTSPNLITYDYLKSNYYQLIFKCDTGVFTDKNVRRALMIGTDLQKIANALYPGGSVLLSSPLASNLPGVYTPLNELPESTRELFNYDPAKAKQMLADAGYANGFTTQITCQTTSEQNDLASLLVDQWSQLGVTAKINSITPAAWAVVFANKSYTGVFESSTGNSNPVSGLQYKCIPCPYNLANWSDAHSVDLYNKAIAASDTTTQNALFKELNVYIIDQCDFIGIASPQQLGCYWPWVKNYSQEVEGGYQNYVPILRLMWLDSGVRKQLGY